MNARIAPSILSADFARLADEIAMCEAGGADWIHVDVMDGAFVPNLTFGAKAIEAARRSTSLPLDVHLMVERPESYFDAFASAGATCMTIHVEAAPHLHRQLDRIRELGCRAGAALNPATSLETVREVAADLDLLLVMTVNPGFGGQTYIDACTDKVRKLREMADARGLALEIEVDGGVKPDTVSRVAQAGANVFVAGTAVFGAADYGAAIRGIRENAARR